MTDPDLTKWPTGNKDVNVIYWELCKLLRVPQMVEWLARRLK